MSAHSSAEPSPSNGQAHLDGPGHGFVCGVVEGFYGRPWSNEQRKNLFERMKLMGLNTYLYGPKDDLKHRFEWRTLYNEEEVDLLRSLIQSARENDVTFVYSLSPGIDIIYSEANELKAIKRKLTQVQELGCNSFALLFDDIEEKMHELDARTFPSFVAAQIAVTNEVYAHMNSDVFFFCPTEYCSTRAVPDLETSDYLNTLGENLHPDIHIMWTGELVIPPEITAHHAKNVAKVLRRKALIWDNLHANDYDPKRIFTGPLKGRPVSLKNEISGLLLNPNCKFEANFVPLYTLSLWNQSDYDEGAVDEEMHSADSPKSQKKSYHPNKALNTALDNWLELFTKGPGPAIPPISHVECTMAPIMATTPETTSLVPAPTIRTCEANELVGPVDGSAPPLYTSATGNSTTLTVQAFPVDEPLTSPQIKMVEDEIQLTANSLSTNYSEPVIEPEQATQLGIPPTQPAESKEEDCPSSAANNAEIPMEHESSYSEEKIDREKLALFVDYFFLPFDYGDRAMTLLDDFQWMHKNSHFLKQDQELNEDKISEWNCRFETFQGCATRLEQLFRLFLNSPNRSLVQELFPYISEAHAITTILNAVLKWMRTGNLMVLPTPTESWWRNRLANVEPWSFGNGLLTDMQKLIITTPEVSNLFLYKTPIPLLISSYRLEPLNVEEVDTQLFYDIFAYEGEKRFAEEIAPHSSADLFFDRCFGMHFKEGRPPHHFRIDEIEPNGQTNLFSVLTSIFSVHASMDDIKSGFLGEYREKYAEMLSDNKEGEKMFLTDMEKWPILQLPESFLAKYPSFVEIRWRNHVGEAAWVRRMFQCAAATLAMNGSNGLFTIVPAEDEDRINLYYRFGLSAINEVRIEGYLIMAHLLQFSS